MTADLLLRPVRRGVTAVRRWLGERPLTQLGLFIGLVAVGAVLFLTMVENMARVGITPGFAFLSRPANFEIGESLIAYSAERSFGRAILVGFLNTFLVSLVGCVLATVIGVAFGIARLSSNPLLAAAVRGYVEVIRNTPLLLQLFFWIATIRALPAVRQSLHPLPGVLLSNRGVYLPAFRFDDGWQAWAALAALAAGILLVLFARRVGLPRLIGAAVTLLAVAVLVMLPGGMRLEIPELKGFNVAGGLSLTPEFAALVIGLAINASASIAEIVRSGIESVPRGQWESARALSLSEWLILWLVVLPQALRVIVPLMTSQYLSLTKNSSLAVAIGYPDLVSITNTTANQTGQALEAIMIMMIVYLTINLTVSLLMNLYDARHGWEPAS